MSCEGWVGVFQGSFGLGEILDWEKNGVKWRNHVKNHVSLDFFEFLLGFLVGARLKFMTVLDI